TSKAKRRAGSAATMVHFVDQRRQPSRLAPLNRAPGAGPVAPSSQRHALVSGLQRPMFATLLTNSYSESGAAWILSSTVTSGIAESLQFLCMVSQAAWRGQRGGSACANPSDECPRTTSVGGQKPIPDRRP